MNPLSRRHGPEKVFLQRCHDFAILHPGVTIHKSASLRYCSQDFFVSFGNHIPVEQFPRPGGGGFGHLRAQAFAPQQPQNRGSQSVIVAGRNQYPRFPVVDGIRNPAEVEAGAKLLHSASWVGIYASGISEITALDAELGLLIDRPVAQLDPVERAVLLIGLHELGQRLDVPYRVVINEGVELAKRFGATDGHKFVNAVLDRAARRLRPAEQAATGRGLNASRIR